MKNTQSKNTKPKDAQLPKSETRNIEHSLLFIEDILPTEAILSSRNGNYNDSISEHLTLEHEVITNISYPGRKAYHYWHMEQEDNKLNNDKNRVE